ncbi:hypothetical protein K470DRAFT_236194 [Piedraia hortae CBS 480.64]|uniref:Conserved oligomeric Golgi complex subunit 2 n=1 Tax=Piedraia hortae CBS 480.64 TaxID=1314780 RepID=A0A6A7BTR4_9PEZI|nr:hypothetical protein K470DRAFT_236194 [Piedraia hortae CBS 480.64]
MSSPTSHPSSPSSTSSLPFPPTLPRTPFCPPTFSASAYLSSPPFLSSNRHRTLEDLRHELRTRNQFLSQELLDLVNSHYEEFLALGGSLKGGGEQVGMLRVGLLAFQREVAGVRDEVNSQAREIAELIVQKREMRREVARGRGILEFARLVSELEGRLGLSEEDDQEQEGDSDDDDEQEVLERHVRLYEEIIALRTHVGSHPLLEKMQSRVDKLRKTILLDLAVELRREHSLKVLGLYKKMGAEKECLSILKGTT